MVVRRGDTVIAACYFRARKDEFFAFLRSIPRCFKSVSSALKHPQRPPQPLAIRSFTSIPEKNRTQSPGVCQKVRPSLVLVVEITYV